MQIRASDNLRRPIDRASRASCIAAVKKVTEMGGQSSRVIASFRFSFHVSGFHGNLLFFAPRVLLFSDMMTTRVSLIRKCVRRTGEFDMRTKNDWLYVN